MSFREELVEYLKDECDNDATDAKKAVDKAIDEMIEDLLGVEVSVEVTAEVIQSTDRYWE